MVIFGWVTRIWWIVGCFAVFLSLSVFFFFLFFVVLWLLQMQLDLVSNDCFFLRTNCRPRSNVRFTVTLTHGQIAGKIIFGQQNNWQQHQQPPLHRHTNHIEQSNAPTMICMLQRYLCARWYIDSTNIAETWIDLRINFERFWFRCPRRATFVAASTVASSHHHHHFLDVRACVSVWCNYFLWRYFLVLLCFVLFSLLLLSRSAHCLSLFVAIIIIFIIPHYRSSWNFSPFIVFQLAVGAAVCLFGSFTVFSY